MPDKSIPGKTSLKSEILSIDSPNDSVKKSNRGKNAAATNDDEAINSCSTGKINKPANPKSGQFLANFRGLLWLCVSIALVISIIGYALPEEIVIYLIEGDETSLIPFYMRYKHSEVLLSIFLKLFLNDISPQELATSILRGKVRENPENPLEKQVHIIYGFEDANGASSLNYWNEKTKSANRMVSGWSNIEKIPIDAESRKHKNFKYNKDGFEVVGLNEVEDKLALSWFKSFAETDAEGRDVTRC